MNERQRIKGHTYITVDRNLVDHVLSMLEPYNLEQILQPLVYVHVTFMMPMGHRLQDRPGQARYSRVPKDRQEAHGSERNASQSR